MHKRTLECPFEVCSSFRICLKVLMRSMPLGWAGARSEKKALFLKTAMFIGNLLTPQSCLSVSFICSSENNVMVISLRDSYDHSLIEDQRKSPTRPAWQFDKSKAEAVHTHARYSGRLSPLKCASLDL